MLEKRIGILLWGMCLIFGLGTLSVTASAKNTASLDKKGNIVFTTTDTKATSGTHWTTVGYTIRKNATKGNPLADKDYAVIWLKDEWRDRVDSGNGNYKITFTIPKKVVDQALYDAGIMDKGEADTIYLNGIFRVVRDGVMGKTAYWTLQGIKKAESWLNPNDFNDRFDVKLPFTTASYPVHIRYITSSQTVIEESKQKQKVKGGKSTQVKLEKEKEFEGKKYQLYRSYYSYLNRPAKKLGSLKLADGASLSSVRNREAVVKDGGVVFVAMMKAPKPSAETPETPEQEERIQEELPDALDGEVLVEAEERGAEKFSAEEGIPGTERLYINGWCPEYLRSYEFCRRYGSKMYPVHVSRTYQLRWTETTSSTNPDTGETETHAISRSRSQTVSRTLMVEREYSYWTIANLRLFVPKRLQVVNRALPEEKAELLANHPRLPKVEYQVYGESDQHLIEPSYSANLTLSQVTVYGGSSCPSVPSEDFMPWAKEHVPQIRVRNDRLIWNGEVVMEERYLEQKTLMPRECPESERDVGENVFYQKGYGILASKKNGVYPSKGSFEYQCLLHLEEKQPAKGIVGQELSSGYDDSKVSEKGQSIVYPAGEINDVTVHTPVVCFAQIEDKFADCQMLEPDMSRCSLILGLPFSVNFPLTGQHKNIPGYGYQDYQRYTKKREARFPFDVVYQGEQKAAGTWIGLEEENTFFLPAHVNEGKYEVMFRAAALNSREGQEQTEAYANLELSHDTALEVIPVEVSGRIYDFSIYDISDYPLWEMVFRKEHSLEPSGFAFKVSNLPLKTGSHPLFPNQGRLKSGYTVRMSLRTNGNMEGDTDYIYIKPRFFWCGEDGEERREVDVYYEETVDGRYRAFLPVGGEVDRMHWKSITWNDPYLSIPEQELRETINRKGLSWKESKEKEHPTYFYHQILLPSASQMLLLPVGTQKWYFEYNLPSKLYVVEKDFPLEEKLKEGPVSGKEEYFLTSGNLCLNFDIITLEKGKPHLSYLNLLQARAGYCNRWKKEGFDYEKGFMDGDVALIAVGGSAAHDYQTRGTH